MRFLIWNLRISSEGSRKGGPYQTSKTHRKLELINPCGCPHCPALLYFTLKTKKSSAPNAADNVYAHNTFHDADNMAAAQNNKVAEQYKPEVVAADMDVNNRNHGHNNRANTTVKRTANP
jgi:hypothetical protein